MPRETTKEITIPNDLTYVGVFLTFRCRYNCSYCINYQGKLTIRKELSPLQWVEGLNRLKTKRVSMVPITLQGGEPSLYPGYLTVIKRLKKEFYIDLLTNLDFDVEEFVDDIPPERMQRAVPYASIRVSHHPGKTDLNGLLGRIYGLQKRGYSIGLFAIDHPSMDHSQVIEKCKRLGIDFRLKEFLGMHDGKLYGTYKYLGAVSQTLDKTGRLSKVFPKKVECKSTELLIAPDGNIHKCHRDLYYGEYPLGNILDEKLE
ncbi:MAG TPA: radical SAM protein, partial [bacterium]|nr:radical SAM protein [bacterium]